MTEEDYIGTDEKRRAEEANRISITSADVNANLNPTLRSSSPLSPSNHSSSDPSGPEITHSRFEEVISPELRLLNGADKTGDEVERRRGDEGENTFVELRFQSAEHRSSLSF